MQYSINQRKVDLTKINNFTVYDNFFGSVVHFVFYVHLVVSQEYNIEYTHEQELVDRRLCI